MSRLLLPWSFWGLDNTGPQGSSTKPKDPGTRLGDRSQEKPGPDEVCPLRLSCTGDPLKEQELGLDFRLQEAQSGGSLSGPAQGMETYEEGRGSSCPATNLLSILEAKGQNLDQWSGVMSQPWGCPVHLLTEEGPLPRVPARTVSPSSASVGRS